MFTRHVLLVLAFFADLPMGAALRSVELSSIPATSKIGNKLLSKARKLNNDEDEEDTTWVMGYSLKFQRCHSVGNVFGAEGQREEEGRIGTQNLVTFKLCPSDKCSNGCSNGGEYVVQMREFVESYLEAEEEAFERACEYAEEACQDYCDAFDDDTNDDENCRYECMADKNMEKCNEEENQDDDDKYADWDFEEKEFMECRELEIGDDDGGPQYYVGPVCSKSGLAIYLGVFSDGGCTTSADSSIIKDYYGKSLPYENESMVSSKCISCLAEDDNDDDGNKEPSELCQELHEQAGRCEKKLKLSSAYSSYYTPSTESCNYIHKTLPALTKVANSEGSALRVATTLAWVFGIGCVALGGLVYHMHKNGNKSGVNLLASDGTSA